MRIENGTVTNLLEELRQGSRDAEEKLLPLVYETLKKTARMHFSRENPGHTLQPTVLVHDAYLQLVGNEKITFENRLMFYKLASLSMRRILVAHARKKIRRRNLLEEAKSELSGERITNQHSDEVLDIHRAIISLKEANPRCADVIELRYFCGLKTSDIAKLLQISSETVKRDWRFAKAWLRRRLEGEKNAAK